MNIHFIFFFYHVRNFLCKVTKYKPASRIMNQLLVIKTSLFVIIVAYHLTSKYSSGTNTVNQLSGQVDSPFTGGDFEIIISSNF